MTIEERIKTHLTDARDLDTNNRLEMAHWQATHGVLSKLQEFKEDCSWLAGTLQDVAERIDRDGEKAVINSAGITGHLGDRINLGGALAKQGCQLVKAWIRERGSEPGPLFCPVGQTGEIRATRMRGESISYILQRRRKAAGVEPFSPHDLRRSCLTSMLANGVDVFTVQKLAGHADPSTTARYDRRGEAAKLEAAQGLRFD